MYDDQMLESIKKVEETRSDRMEEDFPFLEEEERKNLLLDFHPDYKPGTTRELRIGPNTGKKAVNEIADILESYSPVDPDFDLSEVEYDVDVLVIGGGGAGASASLV
ncbi:MAG: succinate dehydrogenase/fumarate reductase flavoprotein subunit, partial [Candidatus Syntropharchaeia archaeon]